MKPVLEFTRLSFILTLLLTYSVKSASAADISEIPLESLMELTVTSVSKKAQPITNAAAAVFVITQEDIKRSGVTTIADALRMAPGVQVTKMDSNKWAISSRGLAGRFANKLLVLMDGRSLYTPYFMGVYWEIQDTLLDDIERIEVIRGPGAALWGANAVNGVINIITKSAENTRGTLISAGGGTYEKAFASARVGTALGDSANLRIYAKHQERDNFVFASGDASNDAWQMTQGGFRMDAQPNIRDKFTLQGDYYNGRMDETNRFYNLTPPYYQNEHTGGHLVNSSTGSNGGNIIGRWQRSLSDNSSFSLQAYYDHSERDMLVSPQKFNTLDIDLQHRFPLGNIQDLVWGVDYRFSQYSLINTPTLTFEDTNVENHLFSAFVHDEITILPNKLFFVIGSRFEQSKIAGFEIQPNARLLWAVTPHTSIWGAVSRASRARTQGEEDITYNYRTIGSENLPAPLNEQNMPLLIKVTGNKDFKSEQLIGYEVGYRTDITHRLSADFATYYNSYKNLRIMSHANPDFYPESTNFVQQYILSNNMHGHAIGAELALDWTPLDWWRLQAAYSYQKLTMYMDGGSDDFITKQNAEGGTPKHQISLRSGFDLGRQVKLDLWLRGTEQLDSIDGIRIPGYLTMDIRLAWKPVKNMEFSIVGQNLFKDHHPEFTSEYVNTLPSEVVRSGYGKISYKF